MKKKSVKILASLLFANNILFAQEEYFVQVNPATCSYTILDSIPIVKWIETVTSTFDKKNRRYIFVGLDSSKTNYYLCSINATTGSTVSIPQITGNFGGLKFDNSTGILYGIHYGSSISTAGADFVSINPTTAAFTIISHLNITSTSYSVTSDDINHRYIFSAVDSVGSICLFNLDMVTGKIISKHSSIGNNILGFQYDNTSGNLYALLGFNGGVQFVSVNIATGNRTIINSINNFYALYFGGGYYTFDEINKQYTCELSDSSSNSHLCTIDATNGHIVSNPFLPVFVNPYNLVETKYDDNTGNLYALHWGPLASSGTTPPPPIAANDTICSNHTASLSATGTGTLSWYKGTQSGIYSYLGGGSNFTTPILTNDATYYVEDSNSTGSSSRATVSVKVNTLTITANASATTLCKGSSVTLTGSGANSYSWTDGVMSGVSFVPSSTKTYTVMGTDGNNCSNTDTINIKVNNLPIVTANSSVTTVCAGGSATLTGTSTPLSNQTTYSWTNGVTDGVGFVPASTKTYTVTGTDGNNCSNRDTTTITVIPLVVTTIGLIASATTVCSGTSVTLTGTGALSYLWSNGSTTSVITVLNSGNFWVQDNSQQCSNKDSINITVIQTPKINLGNDVIICEGQTVTLSGGVATRYLWSNGSTTSSINVNAAGIYWMKANNEQCLARDSLSVSLSDCEIEVEAPNVFTPNNDGLNDVFTITTKNIIELNCKIFNRWGILVGELTKVNEGWEGNTTSGLQCVSGVYYWIVEYKNSKGTNNVKKGFVQLLR